MCIAALSKAVKSVRNRLNSKNILSGLFCVIFVAALTVSVLFGGVRLAYNVRFDDKVITTVSDKKVYYAAVDLLTEIVEGENVKDVLPEAKIDAVVTLDNTFDSCEAVVDAIIDNTDEIISASRLVVDGVSLGCADTDALETALNDRKTAFDNVETCECHGEFCAEVTVEEGYFIESEVSDISALEGYISALDVKTTATVSFEQAVSYKTVTNKTGEKQIGYTQIEQKGENGINLVTSGVVYINGVKTEETTESVEVIKEPVDEIVTVGTAKPKTASVTVGSGFRFPLPSGTWELSCPYGRKGHKGVDLRAPLGTSIMAVSSGRVTLAGRYSDYGNCVIIDHGNGISTLYAHASRLCVNEGDYVSAGEVIALVGSTGNSTGNHLHFEVHIGSNRVNPQPYIGIK